MKITVLQSKKNVVFVFLKRLNSKKESIKQTNKQTLDNK